MKRTISTLALGLALFSGCGEAPAEAEQAPVNPEDVDHDQEMTVDAEQLREAFAAEDQRLVSPEIDLEEGAEQVGLMLTLKDGTDAIEMWVRGRDGDVVGAWHDVQWTFHEDELLAGFGPLDDVYLSVEVALSADDVDRVGQLTFAPALIGDAEPGDITLEEPDHADGALDPAMAYVGVLPRSAWNARSHHCSTQEPNNNFYRAALHHGGSQAWNNVEGYIRQAQAYHMDGRNYCDIAYHFGVSIDGRVFELRPQPYRGGHTKYNNTGNVGVLFIGCFHPSCGNDVPSPQLIEKGAGLLTMLHLIHGFAINNDKVRGHRDHSYAATACPGDGLYAKLGEIIYTAQLNILALQQGNNPDPEPQPEPEPANPPPAAGCGGVSAGGSMAPGTTVTSCDGRFALAHQGDGNVVLYMGGTPLWYTGTHGQSTSVLAMQTDGNLVLYGPGNAVRWSSGTYGNPGASLAVQDDGNLVIYSAGGQPLWHTYTYGH